MILKGNERGNGKQLAMHLLNDTDNEHVTVHEVRGFVSGDVVGAFKESYAISQGTQCRNHLFSLSLNPPEREDVQLATFEDAIARVEEKTGLSGQPRVIVFHEKHGRRHAHCVWSRIDAETMTAKNLSFYKQKLQAISREIYLEQDWKMPRGLVRSEERDPRNFDLVEWQQCKRMGKNARDMKGIMQDCWAISDSANSFKNALSEHGLILAKGDRRGFVAVSHEGEVLSVARYVGKKAKDINVKLGEPDKLPSVDRTKVQQAKDMGAAFKRHTQDAKDAYNRQASRLEQQSQHMVAKHREERSQLHTGQETRRKTEAQERAQRLNSGLKGIWQRVTGAHKSITQQNEREAYAAIQRDREQLDQLIFAQQKDRRALQQRLTADKGKTIATLRDIREDQRRYRALKRDPKTALQKSYAAATAKTNADKPTPRPPDRREAVVRVPTPHERLERLRQGRSARNRNRGPELER